MTNEEIKKLCTEAIKEGFSSAINQAFIDHIDYRYGASMKVDKFYPYFSTALQALQDAMYYVEETFKCPG